ncbi:uncharacterized protein [Gossypium hirsutum]|uniref:Disease resistance N-terminal domain-containing protein n=1 Tax=Gossypium hirsutum TaxID=3635 RepID=A0ABM3B293_GOSHI|nr:uncharacterized protein LOC121223540 [Gossypium hirsutum]
MTSTTDNLVKVWLEVLKDVLYDADDLLDDFSTEALRKDLSGGNKLTKEMKICDNHRDEQTAASSKRRPGDDVSAEQPKEPSKLVQLKPWEEVDTAAWDHRRLQPLRTWRFMISRGRRWGYNWNWGNRKRKKVRVLV